MSILLSSYFEYGIVFAADRNITVIQNGEAYITGQAEKIIPWPYKKAVIGYCGLAELVGLNMAEWIRQFIAINRNFSDIDKLAEGLRNKIQEDFDADFPNNKEINDKLLIIHLGGYKKVEGHIVPVMYHIRNSAGLNNTNKQGGYVGAKRNFDYGDAFYMACIKHCVEYPERVKDFIKSFEKKNTFLWFNNGLNFSEFNILNNIFGMCWQKLKKEEEIKN